MFVVSSGTYLIFRFERLLCMKTRISFVMAEPYRRYWNAGCCSFLSTKHSRGSPLSYSEFPGTSFILETTSVGDILSKELRDTIFGNSSSLLNIIKLYEGEQNKYVYLAVYISQSINIVHLYICIVS